MREIIETYNVFTFDELSEDAKERARDDFATSGDYGYWVLEEAVDTLKAIAKVLGGRLDYSISLVPDRGEYLHIWPKEYEELDFQALHDVIDGDCPFTGVCYDESFKDAFIEAKTDSEDEALVHALDKFMTVIHDEYESMLTDEYLKEHCESNEYEFRENGAFYY